MRHPDSKRAEVSVTASILLLATLATFYLGCSRRPTVAGSAPLADSRIGSQVSLTTAPLSGTGTSMSAVRFLEDRVKADPDDIVALNKLANYYLQLYRETNDVAYVDLALRSARSSLKVLGIDQNLSGLLALAQAEYATHDFVSARDHAQQLTEYQPQKAFGFQVLGDSLLELGEYDQAATVYAKMETLDAGSVATETRLAHLALLRGDPVTAQRRYANALAQAQIAVPASNEAIAWCAWQLGETAFQTGAYRAAERHYRAALLAYPHYVRALASLGRVLVAQGDRAGAISQYEQAVRIIPDPLFVAALGDLYKLAGREPEAAQQYALVERIGRLNPLNGTLYSRQLALFYADHDLKPAEAHLNAARDYAVRRDVFGADAVAWTALKAGKLPEAQTAMKEALRLGTKDARLYYHAGLIARAAGDRSGARAYLKRALALNPQFDPLQVQFVAQALEN